MFNLNENSLNSFYSLINFILGHYRAIPELSRTRKKTPGISKNFQDSGHHDILKTNNTLTDGTLTRIQHATKGIKHSTSGMIADSSKMANEVKNNFH